MTALQVEGARISTFRPGGCQLPHVLDSIAMTPHQSRPQDGAKDITHHWPMFHFYFMSVNCLSFVTRAMDAIEWRDSKVYLFQFFFFFFFPLRGQN